MLRVIWMGKYRFCRLTLWMMLFEAQLEEKLLELLMECMQSSLLTTVRIHFDFDIRFLLVQLYMNALIDQPMRGHIKEALWHLTKGIDGLDVTYQQVMERIEGQGIYV